MQTPQLPHSGYRQIFASLESNSIGAEGAVAMAEALKINLALMTLKIGGTNHIDEDSKSKLRDAVQGKKGRLHLVY